MFFYSPNQLPFLLRRISSTADRHRDSIARSALRFDQSLIGNQINAHYNQVIEIRSPEFFDLRESQRRKSRSSFAPNSVVFDLPETHRRKSKAKSIVFDGHIIKGSY
ncbi:unnamed protein product [Dracunculus medinensis]|uniref:Uncharacterized protein n=1 Tax=Dracunculus medinensis TaxID=318479 RepID=A0A0N4UQ21_DRAME|nr:unnamed protein product [Dracunculus medinensis]